jgi:hypothetical protein
VKTNFVMAAAAAAAVLAVSTGAVMADSKPRILTTTTSVDGISTKPATLKLCPNPAPMFMEYSKGAVPYHPELSVIKLVGTVQNVGLGAFTPGAAPQAIELWVKWGNSAPSKVQTIPLPAMAPGAVQTIQTSFDPAVYVQKLNQYGGSPKLTLIINTNAVGLGGTKDCKMGEENLHTIYGPNAGELDAMGII